jgi:hypothetical protein
MFFRMEKTLKMMVSLSPVIKLVVELLLPEKFTQTLKENQMRMTWF